MFCVVGGAGREGDGAADVDVVFARFGRAFDSGIVHGDRVLEERF